MGHQDVDPGDDDDDDDGGDGYGNDLVWSPAR